MFTFTNKQTYLQYRSIWKLRYAAMSQLIRDLKYCRKLSHFGTERYKCIQKENETAFGFSPQALAWRYRQEAAAMLLELKAAKAEAQRQYLVQKSQLIENSQVARS